ncbi:MAG: transglutaminase family protein [Amaricoccus sp.]
MLYDVGLTIAYEYDRPAVTGRHILRLVPADVPGVQRRITGALTIRPRPAEERPFIDFFGNGAVGVVFREAHDEILFRVSARVERLAQWPGLDISPGLDALGDEIAEYRGLDGNAPHHFLGSSPRTAPAPRMTAYARAQLVAGMTAADAVRAIGLALNRDMTFDPDATTVDTPPEEAFARREGVCQDFAQVMIACLRGVGIPAGYVSGFLRTNPPPGQPRLEGADAMHAWVCAWCGLQAGWVEFDPTNAVAAGADHILVARGRDYGDVAPVTGVLRIAGEQKSEHAVDVVPVDA